MLYSGVKQSGNRGYRTKRSAEFQGGSGAYLQQLLHGNGRRGCHRAGIWPLWGPLEEETERGRASLQSNTTGFVIAIADVGSRKLRWKSLEPGVRGSPEGSMARLQLALLCKRGSFLLKRQHCQEKSRFLIRGQTPHP